MCKKTIEIRLKAVPQDVNAIIIKEQNKMREEKGFHVAKDVVIYSILRKLLGPKIEHQG